MDQSNINPIKQSPQAFQVPQSSPQATSGQSFPTQQTAQTNPSQSIQSQIQTQTPIQAPNILQLEQSANSTPSISDNSQTSPHPVQDNPISTQSTLLISELRDNLVIMKDGSFRTVIACQSINFDLMSETEREGVEYSFQNFLNSLTFTTQILIRSQRIDISPYIDSLINLRRKNDNMLLGILMDDYINFIDILSQEVNIMDKSFFIIIPYYSSPDAEKVVQQTKNFFKSFSRTKPPEVTKIDRPTYDKAITEMNNRTDAIINGLFQIGIRSVRLNTKELAQLYYNFNNPDTATHQPLTNFNKLANLYVKKGK